MGVSVHILAERMSLPASPIRSHSQTDIGYPPSVPKYERICTLTPIPHLEMNQEQIRCDGYLAERALMDILKVLLMLPG